jgi:hypothetical protein
MERAYTNEGHIGGALLPERFESTSIPALPAAQVVELDLSHHYTVPHSTETPVYEESPLVD